MKALFLKIFSIFWIAQSVIAIASTVLILSHRAPDGGASVRSLRDGLGIEAVEVRRTYQQGGCEALLRFGAVHHQQVSLLSPQQMDLCRHSTLQPLKEDTPIGEGIFGHSEGKLFFWRIPLDGSDGEGGSVLIAVPRSSTGASLLRDIRDYGFPQLPIILGVGGATTFLLVLLVTRPLSLLSAGARAMASGDLSARVPQATSLARSRGDAFQALIRDFNGMADRLEALVAAHKLLLRDVSHELRSPLTRLHVALGLARTRTPEVVGPYLDRVEKEADRVNEMIGQLLTLSSMEVSHIEGRRVLSVRELLEALLPDARFEASQRGCTVGLLMDGDHLVYGVRELLLTALENIVRNAVHYTRAGTEVLISAAKASSPDPAVIVQVLDQGPGIPERELDAVFRPFYRTDNARSSMNGGFGVGLAIAKRAVEVHQGTIRASNRPNGGAAIILILPVQLTHLSPDR